MVNQVRDQSQLHACIVLMHHAWRYALLTVSIKQMRVLFYTQKISVLVAVTVSMHVLLELHNFLKLEIMAQEGKWINVPSVRVDLKMICQNQSFKNMVVTDWQKESYLHVQKCVQPKHY